MFAMRRHQHLLIFLLLGGVSMAPAQQGPARPRLARDADTNDAAAYFTWGLERLVRRPDQAAAAFHWAARLEPASPQVPYAQHVALLLTDNERLVGYLRLEDEVMRSRHAAVLDSLYARALKTDPFLATGLEEPIFVRLVRGLMARRPDFSGNETRDGDIVRGLDTALAEFDPHLRGHLAYSRAQYREALVYYDRALRLRLRRPTAPIWAAKARAYWHLSRLDSAALAMQRALALAVDSGGSPRQYESRAHWHYSLGLILERLGDRAAARIAWQNALIEDMAYYPAHVRLGTLALQQGDTVNAIIELERAVATNDRDYFAHAALGAILTRARQPGEAVTSLRRATELEPFAAAAWLLYAQALDTDRRRTDAITAYQRFLALAARDDPARPGATRRIETLRQP